MQFLVTVSESNCVTGCSSTGAVYGKNLLTSVRLSTCG